LEDARTNQRLCFVGRSTDIVSRIMSPWISERIGQQVIVEKGRGWREHRHSSNRKLATGRLQLLFVGAVSAVNVALYPNLPFNFSWI
jgi:hypothetical protein